MKRRATSHSRRIRRITLSAALIALGTVMLWLGALLDMLSMSVGALAAFLLLLALRELGWANAAAVFASTSLLSLLLFPYNEAALCYILLFGGYTLIKFPVERTRLALLLKIVYVNAALAAVELISVFIFMIPALFWPLYIGAALLGNLVFFLYDRVVDRLLVLYEAKWRPKIGRLFSLD